MKKNCPKKRNVIVKRKVKHVNSRKMIMVPEKRNERHDIKRGLYIHGVQREQEKGNTSAGNNFNMAV